MLLNFCSSGFSSWRDLFSYSPISFIFFYSPKNIYYYRGFTLEKNIPNWLTNRRSFRVLLLFDWSANQMRWPTSMGRVSLPHIKFQVVIKWNHNIGAWLIQRIDLLTPCLDLKWLMAPTNPAFFCFDNLKVQWVLVPHWPFKLTFKFLSKLISLFYILWKENYIFLN